MTRGGQMTNRGVSHRAPIINIITKPLEIKAVEADAIMEELKPPSARVLNSSYKTDGTRYMPGERLRADAIKWMDKRKNDNNTKARKQPKISQRDIARDLLERLMIAE